MKKIIILTGNHLRHDYVRKAIALHHDIEVMKTYCEEKIEPVADINCDDLASKHIYMRLLSEKDFFSAFVKFAPDYSNPVHIKNNAVNSDEIVHEIKKLEPDVIIAFGCSLIKSELLNVFKGRFLNVHLGLSPYYRGTGTNFWPLVNNEPEFVGATFMHIDEGIDTGNVIHQIRANIYPDDTPHQIGNRLIRDIPEIYARIIQNLDNIQSQPQIPLNRPEKLYKRQDFSEDATKNLYKNFENNLIETYLSEQKERIQKAPIVINPLLI